MTTEVAEKQVTVNGKVYKATEDDVFAAKEDARRHAYVLQLARQLTYVKHSYFTGKYTVYHRPKY